MKCSYCGEEVGAAKVCPICGSTVSAKASSAPAAVETIPGLAIGNNVQAKNSGNPFFNNPYLNNPYMPSAPSGGTANQEAPAQGGNGILQQIADEKTRMVEECGKAVSIVYVDKSDRWRNKGTGWCGYGNYIITNAHVVEPMVSGDGKRITCEFSDKLNLGKQKVIEVDLVYYDEAEDIAILLPKTGKLPVGVKVLNIDATPTKQGELVFTVGNPEHYRFTYTEGSVANPDYKPKCEEAKYTILQTTLTLNHGNSGGPVMNVNGDVVGMATFGEINAQTHQEILGYGFCVKSEAILAAIKDTERELRR